VQWRRKRYGRYGSRHTNPIKFGQLILWKIITIDVTRCQILRLKCTEIDFGWSLQTLYSWNKGDLFLREEEGGGKRLKNKKGERKGKGRGF